MSNHNEYSNSEKILNFFQEPNPRTKFKSYRDLCQCIGINITGGNEKITILDEINRYCICKKTDGKNEYIITDILDFPLPKKDKRFLGSKFYPICGYSLLEFLSEKYVSNGSDEQYYILTKREVMKIMHLCNSSFSNYYFNLNKDEEAPVKGNEFYYFIEKSSAYLYKLIDRILKSLEKKSLINFKEIYMVKQYNTYREATDEESKKIDDYYVVILEEYKLKNKYSIQLSQHRNEILKKIRKYLGFNFHSAIKFELSENLEINAGYLFHQAKLTEKCSFEANTMVCDKIYHSVVGGFTKIRDKENINIANQQLKEKNMEESGEVLPENKTVLMKLMDSKLVGELNAKFIRKDNFDLDDGIVKSRIEELIEQLIRVDDYAG
jgi:hypothetical protein